MTKRALLLVDLQYDFCPGGSLAVANGDQVIPLANQLIQQFNGCGDWVLASQDWHPANHGSFASQQHCPPFSQGELDGLPQTWWPDHCVQQTHGANLHGDLAQQGIDAIFRKGENPRIDSYSAFFDNGHRQATELDQWLKQRGVSQLVIMGLATDYCVKFTVLDALQLGYQVTVISDGCQGVNLCANDSQQAFAQMRAAGAVICDLQEWLENNV